MRKLTLSLSILTLALIPSFARAQETYSLVATAPQVTKLAKSVLTSNRKTCQRLALALTCTQAQACTAAGAAGGAACTSAQALAANARIYGATQAERETYVIQVVVIPAFQDLQNKDVAYDQSVYCANFKASAGANQTSSCTAVGSPSDCTPCP